MTPQHEIGSATRPRAVSNHRRRVWLLVVPMAVVMPVLVLVAALFGGPVVGRLTMNDLSGHTYTVTAIRVDGAVLAVPSDPPTISFRDEWARWATGCNEVSAKYAIRWSTLATLATTGSMVSTARGCGDATPAEGSLARVLSGASEVHLDDQRLSMSSPTVSIELLEST